MQLKMFEKLNRFDEVSRRIGHVRIWARLPHLSNSKDIVSNCMKCSSVTSFYHALIDTVSQLNMNMQFVELEGVCVMPLVWLSVVNRFSEVLGFKKIFISEFSLLRISFSV
jgi:hypothetical protein